MKFLHISDLHLGRKISNCILCDLQKEQLDYILNYIDENNIDSLLIAGDVYDKPIPSVEAVNLFDYFITRLSEKNINVFIISGNHDSLERLKFANHILERNNIHISDKFNKKIQKTTIYDKYGNINIYMLPFIKLSEISSLYPEKNFTSLSDALSRIIEDTEINLNERNVILYHGFIMHNNKSPETSESEIQIGGIQNVDADIFSDFDYTALGHIHKPQSISKNIVYSGSLLKYSFSESNHKKSFIVIDMKEKNNISISKIPINASKDVRTIKGFFKDIYENSIKSDDFIRVELEDHEKVPYAMEQLRSQCFSNITELVYIKDLVPVSASSTQVSSVENRSVLELTEEFFLKIYNEKLDEEKYNIIKEICKELNSENETN